MEHTKAAIENLARIFGKGVLPAETYRASLNSLVRLAMSELAGLPLKDVQADLQRVVEIQEASRKAA